MKGTLGRDLPAGKRLTGLFASKWAMAALPLLLGAGFCLLNLRGAEAIADYIAGMDLESSRSFLLAGVPGCTAINLPLFGTVLSAALNLGLTPGAIFVISHLLLFALVFFFGCLLRGYWAGIFSLAAAGLLGAAGAYKYDPEQSFYAFFLLLAMALLFFREREKTLKADLLAGLAIGASLLVRSPLFLFPPVLVACGWFWGERSRAFAVRSLVFLAASYVLLVPWGVFSYSVAGHFDLFDSKRAEDNLISAALGSVYTMEGDARRLAGLREGEDALGFYVREAARAPFAYIATVLKRLWHIFRFDPLLPGLFLLALFLNKDKGRRFVLALPVYLVFTHSLLSIEKRYFYPLLYILPPVIAWNLFPRRAEGAAARRNFSGKAVAGLFFLSLLTVAAMEALIAAYPFRAARNGSGEGALLPALERFPKDKTLQELKCRKLLELADFSDDSRYKGDYSGYYKCRAGYAAAFGDDFNKYFVQLSASRAPEKLAFPPGEQWQVKSCLIAKMLREYELGDTAAALRAYGEAYALYSAGWNLLRGTPYEKDRKLQVRLKQETGRFWVVHVSVVLRMWPLARRAAILSRLEKNFELPLEFKKLVNPPAYSGGDRLI